MTQKDVLEKPILIIGAARSGTQLLSRVMAIHPQLAYLDEPSYVWRRGFGRLAHEMYPTSAATPDVVRGIRERFRRACEERGGTRMVEKTPANCLRLGFVRAVLPDARILHLVRDGREVAVSARKKFEGAQGKITRRELTKEGAARAAATIDRRERLQKAFRRGWRKLRSDRPGADVVYWLPELGEQVLAWLGYRDRSVWGPRIPGLRGLMKTHSTLEVAAIQWRLSVEEVLNYQAAHPEMPYLLVRYEDLCRKPKETVAEIYRFCELDGDAPGLDGVLAAIQVAGTRSDEAELSAGERALLVEQTGDTLRRLGYAI